MKSEVADVKNSAGNRYAGTGASAAFLKEFAEGYPWAHVDIAPMAFAVKGQALVITHKFGRQLHCRPRPQCNCGRTATCG